jgi:glutamate dehydrogenase
MRLDGRTITERATRWLVNNRRPPLDITGNIEFFRDGVRKIVSLLPELLTGRERVLMEERLAELRGAGVPEDLALRAAVLQPAYAALGIVEISARTGRDVEEITRLHYAMGEHLQLGRLLERIIGLPRDDRWRTMARASLRDDLHAVHAALTAEVLDSTDADAKVDERIAAWEEQDKVVIERARRTLTEILHADSYDLATISVALRVVRTLLKTRS